MQQEADEAADAPDAAPQPQAASAQPAEAASRHDCAEPAAAARQRSDARRSSMRNLVALQGEPRRRARGATPPAMAGGMDAPSRSGYHDQGRDRFETIETNPLHVTAEDPVSTFSIDVDTVVLCVHARRHSTTACCRRTMPCAWRS